MLKELVLLSFGSPPPPPPQTNFYAHLLRIGLREMSQVSRALRVLQKSRGFVEDGGGGWRWSVFPVVGAFAKSPGRVQKEDSSFQMLHVLFGYHHIERYRISLSKLPGIGQMVL